MLSDDAGMLSCLWPAHNADEPARKPKGNQATRSAAPAKPVMQNGTDAIVE
jgi:hypothetical protein